VKRDEQADDEEDCQVRTLVTSTITTIRIKEFTAAERIRTALASSVVDSSGTSS
jgi:hypothetical protein